MDSNQTADALMDPWCIVPLVTGDHVLFGFALYHPTTGGLSWLRSTPIRQLDEQTGFATTASGRRYRLERHIEPEEIPTEGEEAWLAYDLLIGLDAADETAVPQLSARGEQDAEWVTACKIARHLRVPKPDRTPLKFQEFFGRHLSAYLSRQALGGGR